jgi:hypothetical protein
MKCPEQWREYRRWHLLACYGLLGFPVVVLVAIVLKVWAGVESPLVFVVLSVLWVSLWGVAAFHSVRVPCPRCGAPFLARQEPQFQFKRCCSQCGLGLYEQP